MFLNRFFILVALIFPIEFSIAQTSDKTDVFLMCKRAKSIRWIRAAKLENGKCKTYYSKEGFMQIISSATFFASCEGVLQSVRKNIEEGGFKCSETAAVQVVDIE